MSSEIVGAARLVIQKWERLIEAREHAGHSHLLQGDLALAQAEVQHADTMLYGAMVELRGELRKEGQWES